MSETREIRLDRLEEDVRDIKAILARLEPMIIRIDATLPHLATKAELAEKPSRAYLWGVMAAMVGAQAVALGAAALIFMMIQPAHGAEPAPRPYSCRLLDDAERACAFGSCDQRERGRLRRECLRDGGRP